MAGPRRYFHGLHNPCRLQAIFTGSRRCGITHDRVDEMFNCCRPKRIAMLVERSQCIQQRRSFLRVFFDHPMMADVDEGAPFGPDKLPFSIKGIGLTLWSE